MANAQIGINVGYSPLTRTTTVTSGSNTVSEDMKMTGFFVGGNYNVALPVNNLGVSLGLQFRYSTASDSLDLGILGKAKTTYTEMDIDIPVLLNYGINLGRDAKLAAFAGPMLSYSIKGNSHIEGNIAGVVSGATDYDWFGENSSQKPLNLSLTCGLEFTYSTFRIFGGYHMGLLDLDGEENSTIKTSGIFFGFGYAL